MTEWVLPDEVLRDAPAYAPRPYELADLELLLSGGYTPLTGFHGRAEPTRMSRPGRLPDRTPWPVPGTLEGPTAPVRAPNPGHPGRRGLLLPGPLVAPVA